jgi:hypothetical protein
MTLMGILVGWAALGIVLGLAIGKCLKWAGRCDETMQHHSCEAETEREVAERPGTGAETSFDLHQAGERAKGFSKRSPAARRRSFSRLIIAHV